MPDTALSWRRPRLSRAIAHSSNGNTFCGLLTIICSSRSSRRVDVISELTRTNASRISSLRSANNRLAFFSALLTVSAIVVRKNSSSSSNGGTSLLTASRTPTSAPSCSSGTTSAVVMGAASSSVPRTALRLMSRSSSASAIKSGSPSSAISAT